MTAVWVGTAVLLFWLGFVLDPSDADATDGLHRLLFAVVPIKTFAWVMSVVFLGIGAATGRSALKSASEAELADMDEPRRFEGPENG